MALKEEVNVGDVGKTSEGWSVESPGAEAVDACSRLESIPGGPMATAGLTGIGRRRDVSKADRESSGPVVRDS